MDSEWRDQPLQLSLDLNDRNIDENLITWSTFRAIFDLHQQGLVPAGPLSLMAVYIPTACLKPENVPNMNSPEFSDILGELWKIWEENYFDSCEEFRGRFLHYFKVNYLIMLEYGSTLHLPLTA